jgi:hypothetical protein
MHAHVVKMRGGPSPGHRSRRCKEGEEASCKGCLRKHVRGHCARVDRQPAHRLAARYCALLLARLEADIFPHIGSRPIADVDAPELLDALRKIEKRGAIETALRLRQLCGQYSAMPSRPGEQSMTRLPTLEAR